MIHEQTDEPIDYRLCGATNTLEGAICTEPKGFPHVMHYDAARVIGWRDETEADRIGNGNYGGPSLCGDAEWDPHAPCDAEAGHSGAHSNGSGIRWGKVSPIRRDAR